MRLVAQCMICGSHSDEIIHGRLPVGWRLVPAEWTNGKWVYWPDGLSKIPVCPQHFIPGEPLLN